MDFLLNLIPFGDVAKRAIDAITIYKLIANFGGVLLMMGACVVAWRTWQRHHDPDSTFKWSLRNINDAARTLFVLLVLVMGALVWAHTNGLIGGGNSPAPAVRGTRSTPSRAAAPSDPFHDLSLP